MNVSINRKYEKLKSIIKDHEDVAVAFSGGVDSTLLLQVCHEVLGDAVTAVTSASPSIPSDELEAARSFCKEKGIRHDIIVTDEMSINEYVRNVPDRCYHCKKCLFESMRNRYKTVFDGSNFDDRGDYRPGARALAELGIISPLKEAELTKAEIREISREKDLDTWDRPAMACLASRIPYGEEITHDKLKMIDESESFLRKLGFTQVRVRTHGKVARIEVGESEMHKLLEYGSKITDKLIKIGYDYVTLDLKGYRMGSLNEVLEDGKK